MSLVSGNLFAVHLFEYEIASLPIEYIIFQQNFISITLPKITLAFGTSSSEFIIIKRDIFLAFLSLSNCKLRLDIYFFNRGAKSKCYFVRI